ncbi:hypothetical protein [Stenotrophomonas indicatrix]|uniref:hypothetical protein n=1 Tax=Stenotrophomonas indicatrix TaxID=2045451 RepID=UPI0034200204
MASNIAWASALSITSQLPPLSRVHYSKHRRGKESESYTGADFALLVRVADDKYRAAVFQAKRAKSSKLNFEHLHISPERGDYLPEPQILRLLKYGLLLETKSPRRNKQKAGTAQHLDFIHYIIYQYNDAYYSPLSDHQGEINRVESLASAIHPQDPESIKSVREAWAPYIHDMLYPKSPSPSISRLLKSGLLTPASEEASGWLDLDSTAAASSFIKETRRLMDVFKGSEFTTPEPTLDGGMELSSMTHGRLDLMRMASSRMFIAPSVGTVPQKKQPRP